MQGVDERIVQIGDPVLRQKARGLSLEEIKSTEIQELIAKMKKIVHRRGVGLAAPQIGVSLQIAVIEDLQEFIDKLSPEVCAERERCVVPFHVIINPKIVEARDEKALFFEACLSVNDQCRVTPRATKVVVECLNEKGEKQTIKASGWYARILQHEIGHLNGALYLDIADERTKQSMDEYKEKWLYARAAEIEAFYREKLQKA